MTTLFAILGIGLHVLALGWSLWLLRIYAHRWLWLFPVAILLSTLYALASFAHDGVPFWWQTPEFSLVFYGLCLLTGGVGLHLGLVRVRQHEEALDERMRMFHRFAETAPIGFYVYQDDYFVYGNNTAIEMTGYTKEEMMAMPYWRLGTPEFQEIVRTRGLARLEGADVPHEVHVAIQKKSGEVRWFQLLVGTVQYKGRPAGFGAAIDITERLRTEQEILEISAREQRRIGHDLHDGLGQLLTGIGFRVAGVRQEVRDNRPIADSDLLEINKLVERAISLTRQLAEGLDPVTVDMRGIQDGLRRLTLHTEDLYGIPTTLQVDPDMPALEDAVSSHLYRIAQESVNNAVRHASPSAINLRLQRDGDRAALHITDNGAGFDAGATTSGMGLRIMAYRARMIGGETQIRREPAGGTTVTCRFPLASNPPSPSSQTSV